MEDAALLEIMQKAVKENPNKHIAVMEDGEVISAESRKKVFEIAGKKPKRVRCIGHGIDKRYKHFIY
jgi:capsule polysaccharide export protein KpsC/LpsZ